MENQDKRSMRLSELELDIIELMRRDEAEREEKLQEILREEGGRGFDLSRGPLIRAKLIRMTEDEHVLVVTMHHIVSDGWSMEVIVREFAQLYEAFSARRGIAAARSWRYSTPTMQSGRESGYRERCLERQLQYWKRELRGSGGAGTADRRAESGGGELSRSKREVPVV